MPQKKFSIFLIFLILNFLLLPTAYTQSMLLSPEYFGFIQEKISSYFIYPKEAEVNGWEGIVKVKFLLAADGRIKEIDIAESSGYPLLDAAAILAIKEASPYPFPQDYPQDEDLEIVLPINYVRPPTSPAASYQEVPTISPPKESPRSSIALSEEAKEKLFAPFSAEPLQITQERQEAPIQTEFMKERLPPTPEELNYFTDLALKNNQPTKVAREEIEFAQLKVAEAERSLFPALKVQTYRTDGDVYKIDYSETETKLQVDQPLFYGGRLVDTVNQAKVNLEINQKNYDRLKLDVLQKTETAYYNLVAANMHLQEKEALVEEAKEMLGKIEKLADIGMIIPLEVTSGRTWLKHIQFQIDSIKQDLFMAELTFKQVLNTQETPKIEASLLEAKRLNLELGPCVEAALQKRPEIHLGELLVKFNNYGQKIEAIKNKAFTVDLTSSYGFYQGAYKTEPMKDANNWYIGFKASRPWGASTLNTSYTKEESQPRFGQTAPTGSSTIGAEFNLLDNLKRLTDKKRSDIDLHRATSDFNETIKTITFEVQDAFLNYQKAVLQLSTAETEMNFRRSEAAIIKVRSMVGETSLSNAMESLYSYSDAQSKYLQALANYHISLANLKKATGYGIQI